MADLKATQEVRALPETIYAVGGRDANGLVCRNELFVDLRISVCQSHTCVFLPPLNTYSMHCATIDDVTSFFSMAAVSVYSIDPPSLLDPPTLWFRLGLAS